MSGGERHQVGYLPTPRINNNQLTNQKDISHSPTRTLFEATPLKEEPDQSRIHWPKPRKARFKSGKATLIPLRDNLHVQVAQESGLNRKKCSACGVLSAWGNFDVHHINGDHNDNRPENLTVLCRDCHINVEHGYALNHFPSDLDGVHEENEGVTDDF